MVMAGGVSVSCARTLVFLRLMVRLNPRQAWVKWSISVCRFALGVGRYCRIVSKQHVSDEGLTYFGHGSEAGEIEKPAI